MTPTIRLQMIAILIMLSAVYAVLVAKDPALASSIALGYVAVLLSIFILVNAWKKP